VPREELLVESFNAFISYVEEDRVLASGLADELAKLLVSTWTYERDGLAGISYLAQVYEAIRQCATFVLLASEHSLKSHQVIKEVEQAHEQQKLILPIRCKITHPEFVAASPILRMACGTAVSMFTDGSDLPLLARRIHATISFSSGQSRSALASRTARPSTDGGIVSAAIDAPSPSNSATINVPAPLRSEPIGVEWNAIATAKAPQRASSNNVVVRAVMWCGIVAHMVWAALCVVVVVLESLTDHWSNFALLPMGIVGVGSGILVARWMRSTQRGAGAVPIPSLPVRRGLWITLAMATVSIVLSTANVAGWAVFLVLTSMLFLWCTRNDPSST